MFLFNPLNAELNPIRHLLALVGARHIVHVSRVRVKVNCVTWTVPIPTVRAMRSLCELCEIMSDGLAFKPSKYRAHDHMFVILDLKLSPYCESCILFLGRGEVFPRLLNFMCRRFVTPCLFHLCKSCEQEGGTECSETSTDKIQMPGITQKKEYNNIYICICSCKYT